MIIHILHTNDLHSHFENMPQIATCLKHHRSLWQESGEHILTVDIGDHVDRMNIKTEATWGQTNVAVLNKSGYQYVTIGNNEGLTLPKEKLEALYEHADFTVVLSNLLHRSGEPQPRWSVPYAIHEVNGVRLAILGVTAAFLHLYDMMGWNTLEPLPILQKQVDVLRGQTDAIILLSHLGLPVDRKIAEHVQGIDVILGAHTHHLLPQGERIGSTLIAQAGRAGEHIGHVKMVWETKKVVASSAELFTAKEYPADLELTAFLQEQQKSAEMELAHPVGDLLADFAIDWRKETPFGSFLAASLRKWTDAEIGLANGGLLLTPLTSGKITREQLLRCVPHPINACAVTVNGQQLMDLLTRALQPSIVQAQLRGFGFRGKVMGWMGIDGIDVQYTQEDSPKIIGIKVVGKPIERDRDYRVATVDMFIFNRMFPELLEGKKLTFFRPDMLREILAETINDDLLVTSSFVPRWHEVSPKE